ncbi:MAG: phosphodiester glycosidase family protein, partial [Gemmatimonadales bacterium]
MKTSAPRVLVAVVVALSILVPSWGATAHAAGLPVPAGFEVTTRRDVSPGVEHLTLTRRQTPLVMNVARIARSAPVDLQIVSAFDKVGPRKNEESLEHPTAMCARVGCVVGVNGDFYHPDTEEPFGAVATDGRLLRSPAPGRGQGWQTRDGNFAVGMLPWSGSVAPAQGGAIPIAGVNVDPVPGGVVLYTPDYGPSTRARSTELVVRLGASPVLGQAVSVELLRMGDGYTPIPAGGAVLAGDGGAADALRDLWNRRASAGPITLRLDADAVETIGVYPILVTGGRSVAPTPTVRDDLVTGRHSRTLMGRTADGSLVLVTIDNRWPGVSEGVSTT